MTQVARYQPQRLFAEHEAVKTFHGLDPLTGLPVLIYRFAGRPTAKVGELKSEAIPTILTSTVESGRGQLVVAYAKGYEPLRESVEAHEVAGLLRDSATALYDAARTSVVHGDLRPERFLKANDHVMVEGYGVPWTTWDATSEFSAPERIGGASAPADVFSWARTMQFLAGRHLPSELSETVAACLDADPKNRPNAETIYKRIVQPYERTEEAKASPFDNLNFAEPEEEKFAHNPFVSASKSVKLETNRPSNASRGDAARTKQAARQAPGSPTDDDPFGFGGEIDERPLRRGTRGRRTVLLIALLIGLLVLGALALFNRDTLGASVSEAVSNVAGAGLSERVTAGTGAALSTLAGIVTGAGTASQSGSYLIRVEVVPANVQAELFVVEGPAGSTLPSARPVSVVPGSAVLDRTGLWRLQAQVDGRLSEIQEVRVPEERTVTFSVPWRSVPTAEGAE